MTTATALLFLWFHYHTFGLTNKNEQKKKYTDRSVGVNTQNFDDHKFLRRPASKWIKITIIFFFLFRIWTLVF